jgi:hypothetical protein
MRYLRYLWFNYIWRFACGYTENVLADGLTQQQRDLCTYYHTKPRTTPKGRYAWFGE